MTKEELNTSDNIVAKIPLIMTYKAINEVLRQELIGEFLKKNNERKNETRYAQILDISLRKSDRAGFDMEVNLKLKSFLLIHKNTKFHLLVDIALKLDEDLQLIKIEDYKVDNKGLNFITDNIIESVVNKFLYRKMRGKMQFDLIPKLKNQIDEINSNLAESIKVKEGILITGNLENLKLVDIQAKKKHLWVLISLAGWGAVEIEKIVQ